jgi:hypothetical protein
MGSTRIVRSLTVSVPLVLVWAVACGGSEHGPGDASGGTSGADSGSGGASVGGSSGTGGNDAASGGLGGGVGGSGAPGACGDIETFEDGLAPTREIFVDAAASGPGDGSVSDPYPTLDVALGDAIPGTAIRLMPGTHEGGAFVDGLSGTAEAPIWIGGIPGEERPSILGGSNGFQLSRASFVVVHGLEITAQADNGLNVDDGEVGSGASHDLIFRDLYIHDIGSGGNQDCLKLSGIDRYYVLDSDFLGCSGGSAIDQVGCHHGVIARCDIGNDDGNGVQAKGGSDDILVTQNLFRAVGERAVNLGGSTGFEFFRPPLSPSGLNFEARDIRVVANVFRGGISPIAFVGCVDCLAANNTIVDPQNWVLRILQETTTTAEYAFAPAGGGRFVNNIITYTTGDLSTQVNVGPDTDAGSFTFSNNLWYAEDSPSDSEPSYLPVTELDSVYGEDPGFASPNDESITTASPAAGAGLTVNEVPADMEGDCYAAPPALGAHEAAAYAASP